MSHRKIQIDPGPEVPQAVVKDILCELVAGLSKEFDMPIILRVYVYCQDQQLYQLSDIKCGFPESDALQGELRMRFRATGLSNRFLFFADAIIGANSVHSSCSGFLVRGDLERRVGGFVVRKRNFLVKHNDTSWMQWF